jgi:hypothetical protein
MSTPDNLAQQWLQADDPIAAVMADVRVVRVLQEDLDKDAKRPDLNPMEAQEIEAVSRNLLERLRQADTFVDVYATAKGTPSQGNYLLDSEPELPQKGAPLAEQLVWFGKESLRLVENIDRRLKVSRAAEAERALTASAKRGEEPARLVNAASQIIGSQPYLGHLRDQRGLPSTRILLNDANAQLIAQQQSRGKLQKKNPTAAAAESRSRDHQGSDSVRNSPKSPRAAAAALTSPAPERGRPRDRTASEYRTTSVAPRARSQSPERSPARGR